MNSYKYMKRMGSLELLFPGYGGSLAVFVRPLCIIGQLKYQCTT